MGSLSQATSIGRRRKSHGRGSGKLPTLKNAGKNLPSRGHTETIARADYGSPSNRPAEPNLLSFRLVWLQSDPAIHRVTESLLTPQVAFGCLDRNVSKRKLNLLQFAARLVAESSTCSAIMPHAALTSLCRIPDYAESLVSELRGQAFDRSPCGIFPIQRRLLRRAEGMRTIIDSKHL
jgi:hypothetical protein